MKTILTALALTIAIPVMAHAQAGSAPAAKTADHANMMGHQTPSGHDMPAMKNHMAGMKGHDMAGMTKQDHEKMMLACGKAHAKSATTPSAVQPTHKM